MVYFLMTMETGMQLKQMHQPGHHKQQEKALVKCHLGLQNKQDSGGGSYF